MATLDLTYYSGKDIYSDGAIEDRILQYIEDNPPENYDHIFVKDHDFALFYHLTDARQALLNWYDFKPEATVLEIGGGMGAFTGLLCDKCSKVTTVELSLKRASAIEKRCKDKDNLTILVGDFSKMSFQEKFDYITLIGVLEYQTVYSHDPNVQENFLRQMSSLLKPDGKILLAIENRFGLKYWCGEVDDHTGIPFGSINQTNYKGKPQTVDRDRLHQMLLNAGLAKQKFYYPLPDYKFPRVVYSDACLPGEDLHSCIVPLHYSNHYAYQPLVIDEASTYHYVIANKVFPFFANSFLVEAGKDGCCLSGIDFASVNVERNKQYRQIIKLKNGSYEKSAAFPEGQEHINRTHENLMYLKSNGLHVIPEKILDGIITMPVIQAKTLEEHFIDKISANDIDGSLQILDTLYKIILTSSEISSTRNWAPHVELASIKEDFGPILKHAYCDLILSNCFYNSDTVLLYDQEWVFSDMPASFVMYRALHVLYSAYPWIDRILHKDGILKRYSISKEMARIYNAEESFLFKDVQNDGICMGIGLLRQMDANRVDNNINLLMTAERSITDLINIKNSNEIIIAEKDRQISGRDEVIAEKDMQISGRDKVIAEKDMQISGRDEVIAEKDMQISGRDEVIAEKDMQISGRDEVIAEKDLQIAGRDEVIAEKDLQIAGRDEIITEKNNQIAQNETILEEKNRQLMSKDALIAELNETIVEQAHTIEAFHGKTFIEKVQIAIKCLK